jgi:hypothetical protein
MGEESETSETGEKVENGASSSSSAARRRGCEACGVWLREVEFSLVRSGKGEVSEDEGGEEKGESKGESKGGSKGESSDSVSLVVACGGDDSEKGGRIQLCVAARTVAEGGSQSPSHYEWASTDACNSWAERVEWGGGAEGVLYSQDAPMEDVSMDPAEAFHWGGQGCMFRRQLVDSATSAAGLADDKEAAAAAAMRLAETCVGEAAKAIELLKGCRDDTGRPAEDAVSVLRYEHKRIASAALADIAVGRWEHARDARQRAHQAASKVVAQVSRGRRGQGPNGKAVVEGMASPLYGFGPGSNLAAMKHATKTTWR